MAIKALEIKKALDEKRKALLEIEKRSESFATRAEELKARIETVESDEEREAVSADIDSLNEEKEACENETNTLRGEIDELENELKDIEENEPSNEDGVEEPLKEKRDMGEIITRDSLKYNVAFLRGVKSGNFDEARSLLTENVEGGSVPVPTQLATAIQTAWEKSELLSLVKESKFKGNLRVGFEVSATGATVHVEGTPAPAEEELTLGVVDLKPQNIKKWINVSDEVLEGTTLEMAEYIYAEISYRVVKEAEKVVVDKIIASPATSTETAPAVPVVAMNPAVDTIVTATSMLTSEATDLYLIMNRQSKPAFVKILNNAGYAIDVFDGLEDRIIYTDDLPAFGTAGVGDTYAIVGDMKGVQANMPNGKEVKLLVDPYSNAEKDLVKIVGRLFAGIGVIAPKRFVKINKVATA